MLPSLLAGSLAGCVFRSSNSSEHTATASPAVAVAVQQGLTIRWVKHPADAGKMVVEVEGLTSETLNALSGAGLDPTQWTQLFAVYVDPTGQGGGDALPAIQGHYAVLPNRLRFEPQFPVQPGMTYRVEIQTEKLPKWVSAKRQPVVAWFRLAAPARVPKTVVEAVYPSIGQLPENLLKFYIHFSGPMSRGSIYEHIKLLDAAGHAVELPFLEIDEELWNPELTRLTLFIDPGRIKRGVQPLEELGPAMESGKRYTLVIDQKWQDGDGVPLKQTYRKTFTVTPPDRRPPDSAEWKIQAPDAGTRQPLAIRFPEPMDHALALRLIWVVDADQQRIAGQSVLSDHERLWHFIPERNWKAGPHQIMAVNLVEDLAGNSLGKPFEVDVFEKIQIKPSRETVALPFDVRSP